MRQFGLMHWEEIITRSFLLCRQWIVRICYYFANIFVFAYFNLRVFLNKAIFWLLWPIGIPGIGRKNETDYKFCSSLTSSLRHPKPSFYCLRKLLTMLNSWSYIWKLDLVCPPNYLKGTYKWCSVSFFLPSPVIM